MIKTEVWRYCDGRVIKAKEWRYCDGRVTSQGDGSKAWNIKGFGNKLNEIKIVNSHGL